MTAATAGTREGTPAGTAARRVPVHQGGDDVPGWAGALMRWLRAGTRLVAVNVLVLLGTLLGGVLLGVLPALGAAGSVLAATAAGAAPESVWRAFWPAYRAGFRRLNRLGAPLLVAGVLLTADALALPALAAAAGSGPAAVAATGVLLLGAGVLVLGAWFLPVARRYDEPFGRTWRFLVLAPLTSPGTSLAVLVTLAALGFAAWHLTVLLPLAAVAAAVLLTGLVVDHRLDRLDATPR